MRYVVCNKQIQLAQKIAETSKPHNKRYALTLSPNRKARQEQYGQIGKAISSLNPHTVIDSQCGYTLCNPWKVIKGATGFFGMQIDTRPGISRIEDQEQFDKTIGA